MNACSFIIKLDSLHLVFWKSKHLEVASGPFCLLINSPWLLVFALIIVLFIFTGFNIYCWAGIHFSWSYSLILCHLLFGLIYSFHIWSRDLLREFTKKYEVLLMVFFLLFGGFLASEALLFISFFWASFHLLSSPTLGMWPGEAFYLPDPCELTFANTLLLSNAAVSLGGAFVSLEISSQYIIFFALWSFCLSSLFISLQIKEFRILAYSINDSLYSCLFFFLTALHFFHLILGILLLFLIFFSGSLFCSIINEHASASLSFILHSRLRYIVSFKFNKTRNVILLSFLSIPINAVESKKNIRVLVCCVPLQL